jgi:hypothetical protein
VHKGNFIYTHKKEQLSSCQSAWNSHMLNSITCRSLIPNFTQKDSICGKYGHRFIYTPFTALIFTTAQWHYLGISHHPNQRNMESRGKNSFMPLSEYGHYSAYFHKTHACLTTFCTEFLHQTSHKSKYWFSCRNLSGYVPLYPVPAQYNSLATLI